MAVTKTNSNTYNLKVYIPKEIRSKMGIKGNHFVKRYKTRKEAKEAELQILTDINTIQKGEALPHQAMIFMSVLPFNCIRPASNSHHSSYQSEYFFYYSVIHHSQNIALVSLQNHNSDKYIDNLLLFPSLN